MNTLKGLSLTALLIAGSMSFIPATQANTEAPTQALSAPVEAPLTTLTYPSTSVTTSPAPTTEAPATEAPTAPIVEATVEAPAEAPITAPAPAPVEAPAEVVVEQPTAAPEQPTAAPEAPAEAIVEAPAVDPYSGNPIVDCEAQGLKTAEDFTCVSVDFWLSMECEALTLHGMEYGIARTCYYLEATKMVPHLTYIDTTTAPRDSGSIESVQYAGIFHNYSLTEEFLADLAPLAPATVPAS